MVESTTRSIGLSVPFIFRQMSTSRDRVSLPAPAAVTVPLRDSATWTWISAPPGSIQSLTVKPREAAKSGVFIRSRVSETAERNIEAGLPAMAAPTASTRSVQSLESLSATLAVIETAR